MPKHLYLNNEHVNAYVISRTAQIHIVVESFLTGSRRQHLKLTLQWYEILMHYNLRPVTGNVMVNCIFQKP